MGLIRMSKSSQGRGIIFYIVDSPEQWILLSPGNTLEVTDEHALGHRGKNAMWICCKSGDYIMRTLMFPYVLPK